MNAPINPITRDLSAELVRRVLQTIEDVLALADADHEALIGCTLTAVLVTFLAEALKNSGRPLTSENAVLAARLLFEKLLLEQVKSTFNSLNKK